MKTKTIASVLNKSKNLNRIYDKLNKYDLKGCTDVVEEILNSSEGDQCSPPDKLRCIQSLRNSERNTSKYSSTITTWLTCIKC